MPHILQPADVSLFAPLKNNWTKVVFNRKKENNNKSVNKSTFPILLENAIQRISTDTVKNGFRKCGLYPFNVEAIDFTKCMQDTSRILGENNKEVIKPTEFNISHFLYFESVIPSIKRKEFREAEMGEWVGEESSKELFDVWKKLKTRCKKNNVEEELNNTNEELIMVDNNNTEIHDSKEKVYNIHETSKIADKNVEEVNKNTEEMRKDASNVYEIEKDWTNIIEIEKEANIPDEINTNSQQQSKETTVIEGNQEKSVITHSNVLLTRPTTPTSILINDNINQERQNQRISTSFLDHIFWPEESPEKNNRPIKKERLPYGTTSLRWLQYHENKENLKIQKRRSKARKIYIKKEKERGKTERN
ncbi:hypothetical protein NQ314_003239 [Rhamnusium bicolor]|uniref:Translocon at the inner envelope membrane of chloroplasts 214 n=1 Tax=Rhamnusium bicolor TaxID=1586634 RepID=A0AAV8ZQ61_9CUCU|nr:hypothetical protein NQ314_003239 [Rhamnusium bicolor]